MYAGVWCMCRDYTRVIHGSSIVSMSTVSTAHRSRIVDNTLTDVLLVNRYKCYVRYISVTLPPYRPGPRPSRPLCKGGARSRRMAPDAATAARHRIARTTSCLGAAATAVTRLGDRLGHDAAAVEHRLERVDERLQGGVYGAAPRSSAAVPLLVEAMASTAVTVAKMPAGSEVSDSMYNLSTACHAQQEQPSRQRG